jgi:class 3 adenylate cyclase/tetratricopeptide (TPR) repeat protein
MSADNRPPTEIRKTVTVVFCDLAGSTELGEQLDPESLRRVMSRFYEEMSHTVERHGGTAAKFIGDAVMAVFGIPVLHEDDALRAVRAAAEMGPALGRLNDELEDRWGVRLEVRVGVNTGEVVVANPSPGHSLAVEEVVGDAVNVAARLERAAATGEVLIGADTHLLVRDAVDVEQVQPLELKGKARPVPAWRLQSVAPGREADTRRQDSRIIGRERELGLLEQALQSALAERSCRLVTLLGPAGIGKSRLVRELVAGLDDRTTILSGRCLSYGEGITFWPVAEILRQAAGIGEGESPQAATAKLGGLLDGELEAAEIVRGLAGAIGASDAASDREEIFWAVRRLFEALAREHPVVLIFEDVHWAEPTFLDMIEYLAAGSDRTAMLILCTARPDLLEQRPAWGKEIEAASRLAVEPLDNAGSRELIADMFGTAKLPEEAAARITSAAEGNPLFLEEMIAMLADEGVLQRIDRRWRVVGELSEVTIPPTIRALLASRLDRLSPQKRMVLERASIIGFEFWPAAIAELLPASIAADLDAHLEELSDRTMIRPGASAFAGEQALRFTHILVRDAAYEQMLKETRAELHERFASWVQQKAGERAGEYEEILGYHLEQAHRYLDDLGPLDDHGLELAQWAATRLSNAGRRALARGDMSAAVNLLERAVALVPKSHPERSDLLLKLGIALAETGEVGRADALLSQRISEARRGLPYLSYRDGNGGQQVFDLDGKSRVRIGRNPSNDVALEWDAEVSRSHASLIDLDGSWVLLDDGRSHNGSFVNGQRVGDRHRLQDGDILRFGETLILYRAPPPSGLRPRFAAGAPVETATAVGVPGAVFLSEVQQRVLVALCALVDESSPTSGAAADEDLANQLALSVEAVRENLWALSHVFEAEELPEDERVEQIVERARRSGVDVSGREPEEAG